jgi:hypothetical protein
LGNSVSWYAESNHLGLLVTDPSTTPRAQPHKNITRGVAGLFGCFAEAHVTTAFVVTFLLSCSQSWQKESCLVGVQTRLEPAT